MNGRIVGTSAIGAVIGALCGKTVRRYAHRNFDPLPIRWLHPQLWARESDLVEWKRRQVRDMTLEHVRGWLAIADTAFGVDKKTAMRWSLRAEDPLPVIRGKHSRTPWAYVSAIEHWIERQDRAPPGVTTASAMENEDAPSVGVAIVAKGVAVASPLVELLNRRGESYKSVVRCLSLNMYESPGCCRRLAEQIKDGTFSMGGGWVYVAGKGSDGAVKIGYSARPFSRIADLQVAQDEKLRLLAKAPGGFGLEHLLHEVFAPDWIRGEWFRRSPTIVNFVRALGMRFESSARHLTGS